MKALEEGQRCRLRKAIGERVNQLTSNKQAQPQLFRAIYSAIKERYNVSSYQNVPLHTFQDALRFIAAWKG